MSSALMWRWYVWLAGREGRGDLRNGGARDGGKEGKGEIGREAGGP